MSATSSDARGERHRAVALDPPDQHVAGGDRAGRRRRQHDLALDEPDAAATVGGGDAQRVGARRQEIHGAREDDPRRRRARGARRRFGRHHRPADHRLLLGIEQQVADGQRRRAVRGLAAQRRARRRGRDRHLAGNQQQRRVAGDGGQVAGGLERQALAFRRRPRQGPVEPGVGRDECRRGPRHRRHEVGADLHAEPATRDRHGDLGRDVGRPCRGRPDVEPIAGRGGHQALERLLAPADGAVGGAQRRAGQFGEPAHQAAPLADEVHGRQPARVRAGDRFDEHRVDGHVRQRGADRQLVEDAGVERDGKAGADQNDRLRTGRLPQRRDENRPARGKPGSRRRGRAASSPRRS